MYLQSECTTPGVDNSKITNMCRVRALRILFSLVDKDTIEKHSNQSIQNIKYVLQSAHSCYFSSDHFHVYEFYNSHCTTEIYSCPVLPRAVIRKIYECMNSRIVLCTTSAVVE